MQRMMPEEREVAHSPGNWMSFRPLSGKQVNRAAAERTQEFLSQYDPASLDALTKLASPATRTEPKTAPDDPLTAYSVDALLRWGLVSWRGPDFEGAACDDANKDDLDAATREWAARQVIDVSHITPGEGRSSVDGIAASVTVASLPS